MFPSAFQIIGDLNCRCGLSQLKASMPDDLRSLCNLNYTLMQRIEIEAQYHRMAQTQESDIAEMRKEEAFLIPSDIDFSEYVVDLFS